jgi:hypothetical protein
MSAQHEQDCLRVIGEERGRCNRCRLTVRLTCKGKADTYCVEPVRRPPLKPVVLWRKNGCDQPEPYRVVVSHEREVLCCDCPARTPACRHTRATAALIATGRLDNLFVKE